MGGSWSTSYNSDDNGDQQHETLVIIDDESINQVFRTLYDRLSQADRELLREAQHLATDELKRTMRNCKLHIYFEEFNETLISGRGSNRIILQRKANGEIVWKFVEKDRIQTIWDVGRSIKDCLGGLGSLLIGFIPLAIQRLSPKAIQS